MTVPVHGLHGYAEMRSSAAAYHLERDVLSVTGTDAVSYLQGQCSQDVAALQLGQSADALLLDPKGKIDALVRVSRWDGGFVLDTDAGFGPIVKGRLERFRLRVAVAIQSLEWHCVALRGPESVEAVEGSPELIVPVEWPGLSGVDLLGPSGASVGETEWVAAGTVRCDLPAWEAARIEAGIPVGGREVTEGCIAAELGLVERTVSFTKGCFTGQELVARLDARGSKVARRLCGVVLSDGDGSPERPWPQVGARVLTPDGSVEVGQLTSVAWSPALDATVALSLLHRRVTPPDTVLVDGGDGTWLTGDARTLPLS